MGKASKAVKTRPAAAAASNGAAPAADGVKKTNATMPEVTTPKRGVTPPQFTSLVTMSVLASTFLSLRRATVVDGVGSDLCSTTYSNPATYANRETGCSASNLFFVSLRYHRLAQYAALYSFAVLITWTDPPMLQRLNHCLCASPVAATLAGVTAHMDNLQRKFVTLTGVTYGALFILTNNAYRAGMAPWRRDVSVTGVHDLTLLTVSLVSMGYGAYVTYAGPGGISDFGDEEYYGGVEHHKRNQAQLMFVGIEYLNFAVLAAFALFFLEDRRKRVMMFAMGLSNLFHIFYYLPMEKEHLLGIKIMNNVLFGSAVALLFFAMLPSARSMSRGGSSME